MGGPHSLGDRKLPVVFDSPSRWLAPTLETPPRGRWVWWLLCPERRDAEGASPERQRRRPVGEQPHRHPPLAVTLQVDINMKLPLSGDRWACWCVWKKLLRRPARRATTATPTATVTRRTSWTLRWSPPCDAVKAQWKKLLKANVCSHEENALLTRSFYIPEMQPPWFGCRSPKR